MELTESKLYARFSDGSLDIRSSVQARNKNAKEA